MDFVVVLFNANVCFWICFYSQLHIISLYLYTISTSAFEQQTKIIAQYIRSTKHIMYIHHVDSKTNPIRQLIASWILINHRAHNVLFANSQYLKKHLLIFPNIWHSYSKIWFDKFCLALDLVHCQHSIDDRLVIQHLLH